MAVPRTNESEPPPLKVLPAAIEYASPSVATIRASIPRGRAIVLAGAFFVAQLLAALAVSGIDVYLFIAPELPGSRVRDAFDGMLPGGSLALLASGILFITLRLRQFSPGRSKQSRPPIAAAAAAGVAQVIVVTAAWQMMKNISDSWNLNLFLFQGIAMGFPVLAGLWLGRRNNRSGTA
jgi:hypothetical protein